MTKNVNTKISPPWYTYQKKLKALFENDSNIVVGDISEDIDNNPILEIYVNDYEKFIALDRVMPRRVVFGSVSLRIFVQSPKHDDTIDDYEELYKTLFNGNRIVKDVKVVTDFAKSKHCFIRFQPEVVQFFNDDISDFNGNWSGLAQDIAREVFEDCPAGVHFCTADIRENDVKNGTK